MLDFSPPRPGSQKGSRSSAKEKSRHQHVYESAAYRKARGVLLKTFPLCQHCQVKRSTDAHHIIALEDDGAAADLANLLALCEPCHRAIHRDRTEPSSQE